MNHPDRGTLQALIDGELSPVERERIEQHIDRCGACSEAVAARRAAAEHLSTELGHLDRPAPVEAAHAAVTRRIRPRFRPGALPRAAVIILGFAAAASAAVPGSPVRDWAGTLVGYVMEGSDEGGSATAPVVEAAAVADDAAAGVAITPRGDRVLVSVGAVRSGTRVRVRIVDGARVVVSAERSVDARFETGIGRIGISGAGTGTITIELPRRLGHAEVEVGGRPYVVKERERLRFLVPPTDTTDAEIVFDVRGA